MSDLSKAVAIYGFIQPPRRIERAGISYECYQILDRVQLGLLAGRVINEVEGLSKCSSTESSLADMYQENPENFMDLDENKYYSYVSKLDPNTFKEQDHYKVLGISKLRFQATTSQIKTAYRQKVLLYHPDKGKETTEGVRNEAIFACIQKAYEQLGLEKNKRRAYDSVDPKFDDSTPSASDLNEDNFYEVLRPFFERHSRFSTVQPVPHLGNAESSRADVESFYNFWFDFKSWREFSYNDAEDKSRGEDRWERREIEKMNKVNREIARKKYTKKLTSVIELAYEKDPRVAHFRACDAKEKQEQKKRKKLEKQRLEEEREEEERRRRAKLEAEQRALKEEKKLAQEEEQRAKKQLQSGRRQLRELAKSKGYFTSDSNEQLKVMEKIERVCIVGNFEELTEITDKLANVMDLDEALRLLSIKKEEDSAKAQQTTKPTGLISASKGVVWEQDETLLLIKATRIYPAGCVERWTQITKYINEHSKNGLTNPKTEQHVSKEAKRIKSAEAANVLQNSNTFTMPKPTNSTDLPGEDDVWTASQQKQLESALKENNSKDSDCWDKIAAAVDGKTKKQCILRYKYLVQMIKKSKEKS